MNILKRKYYVWLLMAFCMLASCSTVFEDRDTCLSGCHIRFRYDYNMKWADAFANEVDRIDLYVFDGNGRYVKTITENSTTNLSASDYYLPLDLVSGTYTLVAYGGLTGESFKAADMTVETSTLTDLQVQMTAASNTELHPLWYGKESSFTVTGGYQEKVISLIKDTNKLKVVLQQATIGEDMTTDMFTMSIGDDNTVLDSSNEIVYKGNTLYEPYLLKSQKLSDAQGTGCVVYGQFSLSRLMADSDARLKITNKETGEVIINIPLIDYLLLTEMEGHAISSQEYLDRQDEYSLVFFLDPKLRWLRIQIVINGWTVRLNNNNL